MKSAFHIISLVFLIAGVVLFSGCVRQQTAVTHSPASSAAIQSPSPSGTWDALSSIPESGIKDEFNYGELLFDRKEYDQSMKVFQRLVKSHPESDKGYIGVSKVYCRLQKYDEAEKAAKKAIDVNPGSFEGYFCLENIYNDTRVRRYKDAEKVCLKLLEMKPDNFDANFSLADTYSSMGNREKQLEYLEKSARCHKGWNDMKQIPTVTTALMEFGKYRLVREMLDREREKYPDSPQVHISDANYYMVVKDYDRAEKSLKKALELDPEFQPGYFKLAELYSQREEYEKALDILLKGKDVMADDEHENLEILTYLADVYIHLGKREEAEKVAGKLVEYASDSYGEDPYSAYLEKGNIHLKLGQYGEALESFQKALSLREGDIPAILGTARVKAAQGKSGESEEYMSAHTGDIPGDDLDLFLDVGAFYYQIGKYNKSYEMYKKAHKLAPQEIEAVIGLAKNMEKMGRKAEIHGFVEKAIKNLPGCQETYLEIARLFYETGDYKAASDYIKKNIKDDDLSGRGDYLMGQILEKLKDYKNSSVSFERALKKSPYLLKKLKKNSP